ncbi:pentatricopeptide repeat-containing protein [Tanacetum coccineum]
MLSIWSLLLPGRVPPVKTLFLLRKVLSGDVPIQNPSLEEEAKMVRAVSKKKKKTRAPMRMSARGSVPPPPVVPPKGVDKDAIYLELAVTGEGTSGQNIVSAEEGPKRRRSYSESLLGEEAKCESGATNYFDKMPAKNVASWSMMIDGYMKSGNVTDAKLLFDQMPSLEESNLLVYIDRSMKVALNAAVWSSMLAACSVRCSIELAEAAAAESMDMLFLWTILFFLIRHCKKWTSCFCGSTQLDPSCFQPITLLTIYRPPSHLAT